MPDIAYHRNWSPKQYLSIHKHQSVAQNNHSKWISIQVERQTFDNADYGNFVAMQRQSWIDVGTGNMWGFLQGYSKVGMKREQFGFFQNPNNVALPWHGFPVVPFSNTRYEISNQLIEAWVAEGFMDQDDVPSLLAKKRLR